MSELPEAKVVAKTNKVSGVIVAALMITAISTVIGFITAYLSALVVVKIGIPVPKLVVGMPLIVVGAIAWATTVGLSFRDGVITIAVAGAIAVALIVAWDPPHPAGLFKTESKVTDVQVHNGDATLQLESKQTMSEMPGVGQLAGYAVLLAAFAVIAGTLGHGIASKRKPREP
jgi:hypothetical protein